MSKVKLEAIWQHNKVLPYILTSLKDKISEITAVEKIMLYGSRGRVPLEKWKELEGKDWDIVVQAKCKLKNAGVLINENYHLDLLVLDKERFMEFCRTHPVIELFPFNELEFLKQKEKHDGNSGH